MKRTSYITDNQLKEIKAYLKDKNRSKLEIHRAQALLMFHEELPFKLIEQITCYKQRTVYKILEIFQINGIDSLDDKRKSNAKKLLSREQREDIIKVLESHNPMEYGYESNYWTTNILSDLIKRSYGVEFKSKTSYYLLFQQSKLSFHKPGRVYEKNEPKKTEEWCQELTPKLSEMMLDNNTVIFAEDEMILSSQTTFQKIWLPKGEYPKIEVSNTRENRSIYGFLNIKTGQCHAFKKERQNMFITVECLKNIREIYPDKKLLIIWDGAGWHRGSEVKKFIEQDKKIELIFFPPYSPEQNPQEHVWKSARANVSHNKFIQKIDLIADEFVNYINKESFKYKLLEFSARS